jgi:hypothetical protein
VDEDTQYALVILLSYNLIHMGWGIMCRLKSLIHFFALAYSLNQSVLSHAHTIARPFSRKKMMAYWHKKQEQEKVCPYLKHYQHF